MAMKNTSPGKMIVGATCVLRKELYSTESVDADKKNDNVFY
ncbi:hypothetical protein [Escherichia coli]|nr:hypothetical protein [Escherichia coli]